MGALSNLLAKADGGTIDNSIPGWKMFISDHLDYIAARSTSYPVEAELINLYRYDLKRFLKEYITLSRQEDIAWIVLRLNDMSSDLEFFKPGRYIIPTDSLILQLYHTFQTTTAKANAA